MKEVRFYAGNISKEVVNEILTVASQIAGGCTLTNGTGYWIDEKSTQLYAEPNNIFTVLCENSDVANRIKDVVNDIIRSKTNELSILITERELNAQFVELR